MTTLDRAISSAKGPQRKASGSLNDPYGSHQVERARERAFGEGHAMRSKTKFCVRCQLDVSPAGGKIVGPMFVCADCAGKVKP